MENIREIVSANITNLRKAQKMTQVDLAKKVNYSDKAISRWEKGEVLPDIETLQLLSEIFNVPISYILEKHEDVSKPKLQKPTAKEILAQIFIICEIWTILAVIFAYFVVTKEQTIWQVFMWGIPGTSLFLLAHNRKKKNNIFNFVYSTVFIWSAIVCVFLHMLNTLPWYIFIVGIPMQGILIIKFLFNYSNKK